MSHTAMPCFVCSAVCDDGDGDSDDSQSVSSQETRTSSNFCDILRINNTAFNLDSRFEDVRFCANCKLKVGGMLKTLNNLRALEKKLVMGMADLETQLRNSCSVTKSADTKDSKVDRNGPMNSLRGEVIKELTRGNLNTILNLKSTTTCDSCKKKKEIITLDFTSGSGSSGDDIDSQEEELSTKLTNGGDRGNSALTRTEVLVGESSAKPESPEFALEWDISEDSDEADKLYVSQKIGTKEVEKNVIIEDNFDCPFAPACSESFTKADRIKFLAHLSESHEAKIEKVGKAVVSKTNGIANGNGGSSNTNTTVTTVTSAPSTIKNESGSLPDANDVNMGEVKSTSHAAEKNRDSSVQEDVKPLLNGSPPAPKSVGKSRKRASFDCEHCPKKCKTAASLSIHKKIHSSDRVLPRTPKRRKEMSLERDIKPNIKIKEEKFDFSEVKPYKCEFCTAKYLFKGDLTRHTMITHE